VTLEQKVIITALLFLITCTYLFMNLFCSILDTQFDSQISILKKEKKTPFNQA